MVREMLTVLMDGIKDSNMLIDYYEESNTQDEETFFHNHAKKRAEEVMSDYTFIKTKIGLDQKAKEGDAIAEALDGHLIHEINNLKMRLQ